jgi:hypothetical protein
VYHLIFLGEFKLDVAGDFKSEAYQVLGDQALILVVLGIS